MITALKNGIIFAGSQFVQDKALLLDENGIIAFTEERDIPAGTNVIDCQNGYVSPGFIDLQIYGGGGVLFSDAPSAEYLHKMADGLLSTGTTSFLITLATNSLEVFRKAIEVLKANPHPAVLGLHFEGPYLNAAKSGAHLKQFIKRPELDDVAELLEQAAGALKMITLAPEVCDPIIIDLLIQHGVVVSAGHSDATFEQGMNGFRQGITAATHLFNAMSSFHHRDTGLPGAVFKSENAFASIIADGIHVSYEVLEISKKLMGERLFLITDAVEESRGVYPHVKDRSRFALPDGTLSGSSLTMLEAVKNCVRHAGITLEEALRMATLYPARLINRSDLGEIAPGNAADLLVFDEDFSVKYVFSKGKLCK